MKPAPILMLMSATLMLVDVGSAQTWVPADLPNLQWDCFAASADGNTLVAEPSYPAGIIFISTNGGIAWSTNTLPTVLEYGEPFNIFFTSVASSADGTKLAGAFIGGTVCTSTNSGTTWITNNMPSATWYAIASSADGSKLTVVANTDYSANPGGPIYVSTNSGDTWLPTSAPSNSWRSVASSADGTKLLAGTDLSSIPSYVSTNSGNTWIPTSLPTNEQWQVASSADGNKMVAVYFGDAADVPVPGHVFTSTDSGITWESNRVVSGFFESVAMSADGSKIVVATPDPIVFVSTDFGASWVTNSLPGGGNNLFFTSVASSADGGKLITGSFFGHVAYISQSVYPPRLTLTPASTNLVLAWTVPSTDFVLQQNLDLTAANWVTLANLPTLDLATLQNKVILSPTNGSGFFRLKTP